MLPALLRVAPAQSPLSAQRPRRRGAKDRRRRPLARCAWERRRRCAEPQAVCARTRTSLSLRRKWNFDVRPGADRLSVLAGGIKGPILHDRHRGIVQIGSHSSSDFDLHSPPGFGDLDAKDHGSTDPGFAGRSRINRRHRLLDSGRGVDVLGRRSYTLPHAGGTGRRRRGCGRGGQCRPRHSGRRRHRSSRNGQTTVKPRFELHPSGRIESGVAAAGQPSLEFHESAHRRLGFHVAAGCLLGQGKINERLTKRRRPIQKTESCDAKVVDRLEKAAGAIGVFPLAKSCLREVLSRRCRNQGRSEDPGK